MAIGTPTSIGTATTASGGTTTHTISAGAIPAAADTLAILVATYVSTSATVPTATLTGGGLTWSKFTGEFGFVSGGVGWGLTVLSADASAGMAASTLTLTTSISSFGANLSGSYCTGLDTTASRVDVVDGQGVTGPGSAAWDTTAQTSTVADLLVIGGAINDGSTSSTATGGATELHDFTNPNAWNHTTVYKVQSATGSTSLTGTWSTSTGQYLAGFSSFKAAAGAPPAAGRPLHTLTSPLRLS